jgi:ubiquinol-cytochrome c reductase iron-sulfur subunit
MSAAASTTTSSRSEINRRSFLYATTAVVGAAGAATAAWPLIDQMNPDARVRAAGDIIEVDLGVLHPAEGRVVRWRGFPIFVVRRTQAMLDTMLDRAFVTRIYDPDSRTHQQPSYAQNWHRSIDPSFAVLVGICTECNVIPTYCTEASNFCMAGGYVCSYCASHYDPAGRAYSGIARYNLPVPPHSLIEKSKIALSETASGQFFTLESVERI